MFRIKSDSREFAIRDEQGEKYFDRCMRLLIGTIDDTETEVDLDKILCTGAAETDQKVKVPHEAEEKIKPIHAAYLKPERKETVDEDKPVTTENTEHFFGGGTERPLKIKGFLHIVCEKCGETKTYYAKENKDFHVCNCGEKIELSRYNMRRMYVDCECGKSLYYWTNAVEGIFDINCIDCGAPVPITWNNKKKCYETIRSET